MTNTHKLINSLSLFVVFALLTSTAISQEPDRPKYLPEGSVNVVEIIGPPPSVGSPEFETQMAIVLWLQQTRTPEQVAFVDESLNLNRFALVIGDELFDVDGVMLREIMAEIIKQVRVGYEPFKTLYDIPRPSLANENVKPTKAEVHSVGSYPSGHATRSIVYARILGEVFPDKKDELMELAYQIGYGRAIAGVHYPMDVVAGQKIGNAFSDVIVESDAFKEALSQIRTNN